MTDTESSLDGDELAADQNLDAALEQAEQWLGIQGGLVQRDARQPPEHAQQTFQGQSQSGLGTQGATLPSDPEEEMTWLRSTLNSKETELIDLREQHLRLMQRSQEARENWESALSSKDRAIAQLEEAIMQQRTALQQPGHIGDAGSQAAFGSLQMQLDQRQQQVAHLTSELAELRLQLAEAGGQSADRTARAEQQLHSLRQQLGAATGQLMGRDQEVQMLQERLQDLTDKLADARVQAAEGVTLAQQHSGQPAWQAQMAELQSKLALTNQKLTARDASARKYKDAVRALKAKLSQASAAIQAGQEESMQLKHQIAKLHTAVALVPRKSSHRSLQSPVRQQHALQDKVAELAGELAACQGKYRALADELLSCHGKLNSTQQQLVASQHSASMADSRHEDAVRQLDRAKEEVRRAESRAAKLQERLQDAEHHAGQMDVGSGSADRRLHDLELQAKEAERRTQHAETKLAAAERRCGDMDAHQRAAERNLVDLERQTSELQSQLSEAHRRLRDADNRVMEAQAAAQETKHQLEKCQSTLRSKQHELCQADAGTSDAVKAAKAKWDAQRQEDQQELQGLRLSLARMRLAKDKAEATVSELESNVQMHRAAAAALKQAASTQPTISKLQAELAAKEHTIGQLCTKVDLQQARHSQAEADLRAQLGKRSRALSDANQRFAELEAVMRRMAARTALASPNKYL